ncbi:MAG: Heimdall-CTERM domain-containing surface protein [Candidatus Hodarchaeales archaeon]|jgi:hypothetical protein
MKKHYYLFGLVITGLLFLGGLSFPVLSVDDEGPEEMPGTYEIDYDLSLTNVWDSGPVEQTPNGRINTNLWYNVSSMVSPLDQFFNVGNIIPMLPPDSGGIPSFAIDGTFENSKLFVKVINDQEDLIDWQAALMIGEDINISWEFPEPPPTGGDTQDDPMAFLEFLPTSFVFPAGTSTPPFPVVRSTTKFSQFFDFMDLTQTYGFEGGLPFVSPGIFLLDNVTDAYSWWENDFPIIQSTIPFPMTVTTVHGGEGTGFDLTLETEVTNGTHTFANASIWSSWNSSGFLESFGFKAFPDMDESNSLDADEEVSILFELVDTEQPNIPVSPGDSGKYVMNTFLNITADLVDNTGEEAYNDILEGIETAINELDGRHLLNYTIDSMDGLYYHLDGYYFMLEKFMKDRLDIIPGFGDSESNDVLPSVESYYIPLSDMASDNRDGFSDFAINMFDALPYQNTTEFYMGYKGHDCQDEMGNYEFHNLRADNDTYMPIPVGPGVVEVVIFENADWLYQWDPDQVSFMENYANKIGTGKDVYTGSVDYVERISYFWNETSNQNEPEWDGDQYRTHLEAWITDGAGVFDVNTDYYAVLKMSELPGLGFTSYRTDQSPFMLMRFGGSDNGPESGGTGSQDDDSNDDGPPVRPEQALPFPVRTPDWEIIGGTYEFMESVVTELSDMLSDEGFLELLKENFLGQSEKNRLNIESFDFGLVWSEDAVNVGLTATADLVMNMTVDDLENEIFREFDIDLTTEEAYLFDIDGYFDTVVSTSDIWLDYNFTDYHVYPPSSTSEELPTTTEPDETSSEDATISAPGFEFLFALGGIIAIPIIYKRKR